VKCLEIHKPKECKRKKEDEGNPKCVNCLGEHAANSRQCPHYISYSEKVQRNRNNRRAAARFVENEIYPTHSRNFVSNSTAHRASLGPAAPGFNLDRDFPQISHPTANNVSFSRNGNSSAGNPAPVAGPTNLSAIAGIDKTLANYAKMIAELKSAKGEPARMRVLIKFLNPELLSLVNTIDE